MSGQNYLNLSRGTVLRIESKAGNVFEVEVTGTHDSPRYGGKTLSVKLLSPAILRRYFSEPDKLAFVAAASDEATVTSTVWFATNRTPHLRPGVWIAVDDYRQFPRPVVVVSVQVIQ